MTNYTRFIDSMGNKTDIGSDGSCSGSLCSPTGFTDPFDIYSGNLAQKNLDNISNGSMFDDDPFVQMVNEHLGNTGGLNW